MKSGIAGIMVIFLTTVAVMALALPDPLTGKDLNTENKSPYFAGDSLPGGIQKMINSSCIKCHATGGKALAMSKLNFSEWGQYDREKQMKKAAAMCKILTKGKMPPKSYVRDHPDGVPTKEQKEMVCKWAQELKKVK